MPIYEYQCSNCKHRMEAIQKISDAPLKECPECNQATLRKLVSAAAFKLTGTGWYETDFKNKKPRKKDLDKEDGKSSKNKDSDKTGKTKTSGSGESGKSTEKSESKASNTEKKKSTAGNSD